MAMCGQSPNHTRLWTADFFRTPRAGGTTYPTTSWTSLAIDGSILRVDWCSGSGYVTVPRECPCYLVLVRVDLTVPRMGSDVATLHGSEWWNAVGHCWAPTSAGGEAVGWNADDANVNMVESS